MFFSNHNDNITYSNHFNGLLEVNGEGALCREDAEVWGESGNDWAQSYDVLSVTEGITSLGEGYLDAFPMIGCLILSRTVVSVAVTPALVKEMRKRKVLIRGEYDTFAESFAIENKLDFLHSDIHLADCVDEEHYEREIITLRFHADSASDIHRNIFTPGSSAGSYGGGEITNELPKDFYIGRTVEEFAGIFRGSAREQILSNEAVRRFFEAANRR